MAGADSTLDPRRMREVRTLLRKPRDEQSMIPVVAAAAFFAIAALSLAVTVIVLPPVITLTHIHSQP
ncbi:MAG: hypothetical protein ACHP84_18580 [Caulobacterales bacterium]